MQNKTVVSKPSETAFYTALRRTLAHLKFSNNTFGPDYLASIFLPAHFRFFLKFQKIRENTWNKMSTMMPGLTYYVIARTAFFDEQFLNALKSKTPQIVLLGAGYDSRAYRFANLNQETRIFELDSSPTQQRKIKCLKKAKVEIPASVTFIPINFMQDNLLVELVKNGFHEQKATLFLWEGVSYYLDRQSVISTLQNIKHCTHDNNRVVMDYSIPITEEILKTTYGAETFLNSMREFHENEKFLFAIKDEEIDEFLTQNHLRLIELLDNKMIEQKYLLDQSGKLIGKMTGNFRFVIAT